MDTNRWINRVIDGNLFDFLEEGVKEIVRSFISRGYITISSCEGHGQNSTRYVNIAFPQIRHGEYFKNLPCPNGLNVRDSEGFLTPFPPETDLGPESFIDKDGMRYLRSINHTSVMCNRMYKYDSDEWCVVTVEQTEDVDVNVWLEWINGLPKYKW